MSSLSKINSTEVLLGAGETFTGQEEANKGRDVMVSCYSDVSGTIFFDFAAFQGSWRTFPSGGFKVSGGIHEFHVAVKGPRYFRVRYVNDSSAQSEFELAIYYGEFAPPNAPLNQILGADSDARLVRSYPESIDRALGRLGGIQDRAKYGFNNDIDPASGPEDSWAYGGVRNANTGATFSMFVASDNPADLDVDMVAEYLDASGVRQEVTFNLNGTTPVDLGITATDSFRGFLSKTSNNAPLGDVAATRANNFTAGVPDNANEVLWFIPQGKNQTQVCADKCPANKIYIINYIDIRIARTSGAAGSAVVEIQVLEDGSPGWLTKIPLELTTGAPASRPVKAIKLNGADQFRVHVISVSDLNTTISSTVFMDEVDA